MRLGMGALPSDGHMFGKIEGSRSRPFCFSDRWRDAVKSRRLPKNTFVGLRHSHASAPTAQGGDIVTVSHRLGHQSPAFTLSTNSH
jgi:integrase